MFSRFLPKLGVSGKLTLLTTLFAALSFLAVEAYFTKSLREQMRARMESETRDTILIAQKSLAQALWTFDKIAIASTTEALLQTNVGMIKLVRVIDPEGKTIFEKFADSVDAEAGLEKLMSDKENFIATGPISFEDKTIGVVKVVLSEKQMISELNRMLENVFWLALISISLVSTALFLLIRYYLSKPIRGLVEMAHKIESGAHVDERQDWPLEFGTISKAFTKASETIQKRDLSLREYNEKLEGEVLERTKKIDEQRMAIIESSRMASLGEMSAGIAHEINNPLAVISGKTSLLQKKLQTNPDYAKYAPDLTKILDMVTRITKIISGLRTFARDASQEEKSYFKAEKLFDDLKDLCSARLKNHGVELKIEIENPDLMMSAREVQISQVLVNLINNAADAIQHQEEKWIILNCKADQQMTTIRITDSGPGIPASIREKIMQPFFTTKEAGKGTGLGLSISLGIIKDHGGTFTLDESCPNTCFVIQIPNPQVAQSAA